jgi:hypothetical protein
MADAHSIPVLVAPRVKSWSERNRREDIARTIVFHTDAHAFRAIKMADALSFCRTKSRNAE